MRFTIAAAAAALVAGVSAYSNGTGVVYTTDIVTAYTTYCPAATSIVHGNQTYTVTEATTLTITNCPCTITKPVTSATVTYCPTCTASPVAPISTSAVGPVYTNGTGSTPPTSTAPGVASGSGAPTKTAAATFTGAANKAFAASGAGLAGLVGLAAYIL